MHRTLAVAGDDERAAFAEVLDKVVEGPGHVGIREVERPVSLVAPGGNQWLRVGEDAGLAVRRGVDLATAVEGRGLARQHDRGGDAVAGFFPHGAVPIVAPIESRWVDVEDVHMFARGTLPVLQSLGQTVGGIRLAGQGCPGFRQRIVGRRWRLGGIEGAHHREDEQIARGVAQRKARRRQDHKDEQPAKREFSYAVHVR
ncbi:MAG: hypothetical protein RLZZ303_1456 [Candidatus Hydrogenedentota bacterium]